MILDVFFDGSDFRVTAEPDVRETRAWDPASATLWAGWQERYRTLTKRKGTADGLVALGAEMHDWLETTFAQALSRHLKALTGDLRLELRAPADMGDPEDLVQAFLALPWEILVRDSAFLADRDYGEFIVVRRIGERRDPPKPNWRDLGLMFMAAAPQGQAELDHEEEEYLIQMATRGLGRKLYLGVEESGTQEFLTEALNSAAPMQMLHLTCHGGFDNGEAVLVLEDAEGGEDLVNARQLRDALPDDEARPQALFLSACHTADAGTATVPLTTSLVRSGFASLIGWADSVLDVTAKRASEVIYAALANGKAIDRATASTRRELLRLCMDDPDAMDGQHWHLLRNWLGPGGGGALAGGKATAQRADVDTGMKAFLGGNKEIPVASRLAFVGRRKEVQEAIRWVRDGARKSLLIQGMGRQGKSSLAARICNRLPHFRTAATFGRATPVDVLNALKDVVENTDDTALIVSRIGVVEQNPGLFEAALVEVLQHCFGHGENRQPVLLVLDDLERMLEPVAGGDGDVASRVRADCQQTLRAVLKAFDRAATDSRLIMTSRYDFALEDENGTDLTRLRRHLPLPPMKPRVSFRQLLRRLQTDAEEAMADLDVDLLERIIDVGRGNAGLQDLLTQAALRDQQAALRVIAEVEAHLAGTDVLAGEAEARAFIESLSIAALLEMLPDAGVTILRVLAQLRDPDSGMPWPVPVDVAETVIAAQGAGTVTLPRLSGLGVIDRYRDIDRLGVNPLVAAFLATSDDRSEGAGLVFDALWEAVRDDDGNLIGPDGHVLAEHAQRMGDPDRLTRCAWAGLHWLFDRQHRTQDALDLAREIMALLEEAGNPVPIRIARKAADIAARHGDGPLQDEWLQLAAAHPPTPPDRDTAILWKDLALRHLRKGEASVAEKLAQQAIVLSMELGEARDAAIAHGALADILFQHGNLDEAMRIRKDEELPTYEQLGDRRSRAVTWGKIADILFKKGDLDEAMRIRKEEELPTFEQLGDRRSRALTWGNIADILFQNGDLDEAMRIRKEEELPIFEQLGDRRSRAVTWGNIADILFQNGDLDEAMRIRKEEELPTYEQLGDRRSRAVTWGQIADILFQQGDLDEAMRIRKEEQLPTFEQLGDRHSLSVLHFRIAQALLQPERLSEKSFDDSFQHADTAFRLGMEIQTPDVLSATGNMLGQLLMAAGAKQPAIQVLSIARDANLKLGDQQGVAFIDQLIAQAQELPDPEE